MFLFFGLWPPSAFSAGLLIRDLRIEGVVHTQEAQIREAIQVEVGQDLSQWDVQLVLRGDVKRVARLEGIQDVTVTTEPVADGIRLIYEVLEYPILADIRFSGNRKYDDKRLRRELGFLRRTGFFRTERVEVFRRR